MKVPFYQVDAFAAHQFGGNPAAVMLLDDFLDDALLQAIAGENNLSETAFLVRGRDDYRIRWFTPTHEVSLCGHATLASAAVVLERLERGWTEVRFRSPSEVLVVTGHDGHYRMDFSVWPTTPCPATDALARAVGAPLVEVASSGAVYLARVRDAATVGALEPDLAAIARLDCDGVIVTASDDGEYDFVSRFFAPALGIPEDPVTGAAHCMLAPFWAARLGRTRLRARQASRRGGVVECRLTGDRVAIEGACAFYIEGIATI